MVYVDFDNRDSTLFQNSSFSIKY